MSTFFQAKEAYTDPVREGSRYQIGGIFAKVPKRGGGVIYNSKIYVADFLHFKQGFLIVKLIQNRSFGVQGMFFNNCIEKNHTSLRDGSRYQIRIIFGSVPNSS